jgi:WD40 repeat protein/serine/threonine protein kinase
MNEESIFTAALQKDDPTERTAYLDAVCAGDPALRQRVEELLESYQHADRFLEQPALEQQVRTERVPADNTCPTQTRTVAGEDEENAGMLSFLDAPEKEGGLGRLGHYEVQELVGHGGMGIVLKAFDEELHRIVAIKVMAPQFAASATARRRFKREAQAAAAVRDDHVVDIHAVEEAKGLPYLVMEYINGISLQDRLDCNGPLELNEILRIGMQAAAGLAAAHKQGLIHRDVKPANILLENGVQRVKLTDFGLARAVDDVGLTQSGVVAGTPQYMSPEQADAQPVDHRSDLFSLGSVLYAMCTGRPPFRASSTPAVLKRVYEDSPRPIQEINPEVPSWLVQIIEKLHVKNPAQRFQSAAEVAELLEQHLAHLAQPVSMPRPSIGSTEISRQAGARGHLRRWAMAAALLALLFSGLYVTEVTGVTHVSEFVTTALRIRTPDGTLVVEVNDPLVKVTIDGDGQEIAIAGAGPQEVRLRPGRYQVRASRDGMPVSVDQELVTITRGDKQLVKVSRESQPQAQANSPLTLRATLRGNGDWMWSLAFMPGGRTLASGSNDQTLRVWDVEKGILKTSLNAHQGMVSAVAITSNGGTLATGSTDRTVKLWDASSLQLRATLDKHTAPVEALAFSPDGKTLASASADRTVRLWDAGTGAERTVLQGGQGRLYCVAYSPNGKTLVSGGEDGTVIVWDPSEARKRFTLGTHRGWVRSAAFSRDSRLLATASEDGTVKLWEAASGVEVATLTGHRHKVFCVAFSPDGKTLASAGGEWEWPRKPPDVPGEIKLWDVAGRRETGVLDGHQGPVFRVAFSDDGKTLASASADGTVRLWNMAPMIQEPRLVIRETRRFEGHAGPVRSVALSPDGRYALSGSGWPEGDKTMRLWEVATGHELRQFAGHTDQIHAVAFSSDGNRALSGGFDGTMRLWDVQTGQELRRFRHPARRVLSVAYSPDGRWAASATADGPGLRLWEIGTGKMLRAFQGHTNNVLYVTFSPDGRRLLSASHDGTVRLWDAESGRELRRSQAGAAPECVAWSSKNHRAASSGQDGLIRLWDLETGEVLRRLKGHVFNVAAVTFSPDGRCIASGGQDGTVRLWDAESGEELCRFMGHAEAVWSIAFSSDGRHLLSGGGGDFAEGRQGPGSDWALRLWDVPQCNQTAHAVDRRPSVPAVAPFVILGHGKANRAFTTLAEAVAATESGDTIEVRGDGPFISPPLFVRTRLTIRAGTGFLPVIEPNRAQAHANIPLLDTSAPLVLEGLHLRGMGNRFSPGNALPMMVLAHGAPLRVTNCRFDGCPNCVAVFADWSSLCELRNCAFVSTGKFARVDHRLPHGGRMTLENNVMIGGDFGAAFHYAQPDLADAAIKLSRNTLVVHTPLGVFLDALPRASAPTPGAAPKPISLNAADNILDGHVQVVGIRQGVDFLSRGGSLLESSSLPIFD